MGIRFINKDRNSKKSSKPRFLYTLFWTDIYYETKWKIWAIRKYLPIVLKMKSYDYYSILEMLKFQLTILQNRLENGNEVKETRIPKVNRMKETISLLHNKLEDNYQDRIEAKEPDYNVWFDKIENSEHWELKNDDTRTEAEKTEYYKQLRELEEKEWNKIFKLLTEMRDWWD